MSLDVTAMAIDGRALRPPRAASSWLGHVARLPVPQVALVGAVLYGLHIDTVYGSIVLLVTLSTLLNPATSLPMAYLSARTYRVTGSPAMLALGGGALAFWRRFAVGGPAHRRPRRGPGTHLLGSAGPGGARLLPCRAGPGTVALPPR